MYSPVQSFSPFASTSSYQDYFHDSYSTSNQDSYDYIGELSRGVPTTGIYAQDGIWEEDELSSEATTIRPSSGSTFGHSSKRRQSIKPEKSSGRSRSGTVGSVHAKEEKSMWAWGRKPSGTNVPLSPVELPASSVEVTALPSQIPFKSLEKKKSKSLLRGKGRRGELSVQVSPNGQMDPVSRISSIILTIAGDASTFTADARLAAHLSRLVHRLDAVSPFLPFSLYFEPRFLTHNQHP